MHKNAIKIVLGGQKLCAFSQKYGTFWGKNLCAFFVHFLDKLGAPLRLKSRSGNSSNFPRSSRGISFFSSFLTRNQKPRKMQCVFLMMLRCLALKGLLTFDVVKFCAMSGSFFYVHDAREEEFFKHTSRILDS